MWGAGFGEAGEAQGKRRTSYHYYTTWGSRGTGNFEAHSFDSELLLMAQLLSPKRSFPIEGSAWWRPTGAFATPTVHRMFPKVDRMFPKVD